MDQVLSRETVLQTVFGILCAPDCNCYVYIKPAAQRGINLIMSTVCTDEASVLKPYFLPCIFIPLLIRKCKHPNLDLVNVLESMANPC
ncbi:hypothetical protein Y032_0015g2616 [Ancylostoma ceylanicum]|uniref:Uncharacterized protein n=1 Tax=Ancylostoma ceylanicum TaxID=53326 RepID=A0A016V7W7_9BILA|nr:hypothetical protein Y032_0015g2616 [Ancylostoma ceylanicum]